VSTLYEFACHISSTVTIPSLLLEHIGKEEELEHKEDDNELDEYDCPKHTPYCHTAKSVYIETVHLI